MSLKEKLDQERIPRHVAIIMDGNGRWAKQHGLERYQGHIEGVESVRAIAEAASELGIDYLTLYTFSTENWNRPQTEVEALMSLLVSQIEAETPTFVKNNIRFQIIGDAERLPQDVRQRLERCINETASHTGLTLVLALSYSSRWEITNAVRQIARAVARQEVKPEEITETLFSSFLTTQQIPDPDLLIRTGKECRISNYLLWQISYSELAFPSLFWPEFRKEEFYQVILDYQQRERRFGKTSEQL